MRRTTERPRSPLIRPLETRDPGSIDIRRETLEARVAATLESSSGPFPPPMFLERYDRIVPGIAEELMRSGIRRVDASTKIDLDESQAKQDIDRLGQHYAFAIVVFILVIATIWLLAGYPTPATILASTTVVALIIAFLGSSRIEQIAPHLTGRNAIQNNDETPTSEKSDKDIPTRP